MRSGRAPPHRTSSGAARGTRLRPRRSRARQIHGRGCKRKEREHTARFARGPIPGSGTKPARRRKRSRRRNRLPAVPVALAARVDPRRRARSHGRGQHRGGPCQRRSSCSRRRRDRRRRASRGIRLVVASRDRRAPPPLGGIHRRQSGAAHSLARLGRAPSAGQAAEELTCLHRRAVRLHGRSRTHLVVPRRGVARAPPRGHARHGPTRRVVALGFASAFRIGTLPGGRCYPARSSSRSAFRCFTG